MVILGQLKVNTKIEKIQKLRKVKLDERKIIIYVNTEILNNKNEQNKHHYYYELLWSKLLSLSTSTK